jgi:hypothetical protein
MALKCPDLRNNKAPLERRHARYFAEFSFTFNITTISHHWKEGIHDISQRFCLLSILQQ